MTDFNALIVRGVGFFHQHILQKAWRAEDSFVRMDLSDSIEFMMGESLHMLFPIKKLFVFKIGSYPQTVWHLLPSLLSFCRALFPLSEPSGHEKSPSRMRVGISRRTWRCVSEPTGERHQYCMEKVMPRRCMSRRVGRRRRRKSSHERFLAGLHPTSARAGARG